LGSTIFLAVAPDDAIVLQTLEQIAATAEEIDDGVDAADPTWDECQCVGAPDADNRIAGNLDLLQGLDRGAAVPGSVLLLPAMPLLNTTKSLTWTGLMTPKPATTMTAASSPMY
jgi:hypothetical protein